MVTELCPDPVIVFGSVGAMDEGVSITVVPDTFLFVPDAVPLAVVPDAVPDGASLDAMPEAVLEAVSWVTAGVPITVVPDEVSILSDVVAVGTVEVSGQ